MLRPAVFTLREITVFADRLGDGWPPRRRINPWLTQQSRKTPENISSNMAEGGFTLIEILVALSILSIALVVILGSFQLGLKSIEDAADRSECLAVAESTLAAEGVVTPLAMGEETGSTATGDRWSINVQPWRTPDTSDAQSLAADEIDVTVTRNHVSVSLSTLRSTPVTNENQ